MPGAVFVLLLVGSLGVLFQSDDQQALPVGAEPALFREFFEVRIDLKDLFIFFV